MHRYDGFPYIGWSWVAIPFQQHISVDGKETFRSGCVIGGPEGGESLSRLLQVTPSNVVRAVKSYFEVGESFFIGHFQSLGGAEALSPVTMRASRFTGNPRCSSFPQPGSWLADGKHPGEETESPIDACCHLENFFSLVI